MFLLIIRNLSLMIMFIFIPIAAYFLILRTNKLVSLKFRKVLNLSIIVSIVFLLIYFIEEHSFLNLQKDINYILSIIFTSALLIIGLISNKGKVFYTFNDLYDKNTSRVRIHYSINVVVITTLVLCLITYLKFHALPEESYSYNTEMDIFSLRLIWLVITFIVNIVIVPLAEEIFFRGIIFLTFKEVGKKFAIISSSIMWALVHPFDIGTYINVILMGMFLAYIFDKSGFISVPILIHVIANCIYSFGLILKYLFYNGYDFNPVHIYLIMLVVICTVGWIVKFLFEKRIRSQTFTFETKEN